MFQPEWGRSVQASCICEVTFGDAHAVMAIALLQNLRHFSEISEFLKKKKNTPRSPKRGVRPQAGLFWGSWACFFFFFPRILPVPNYPPRRPAKAAVWLFFSLSRKPLQFYVLAESAVKKKKKHAHEPQKRPACGLTPLLGLLGVFF